MEAQLREYRAMRHRKRLEELNKLVPQQNNQSTSSEGFPTTMSNESNEDEVLLVRKKFNFLFKIIFDSFTI